METLAQFRHFALYVLFPVSKVTKVPKVVESSPSPIKSRTTLLAILPCLSSYTG